MLGACGTDEATDRRDAGGDGHDAARSRSPFYNWSDYMSPQCLKDFEDAVRRQGQGDVLRQQRGSLIAKLSAGATGYDVICPTDM